VRDYLAHRGYEVRAADGWSCDSEEAPIVAMDSDEAVLIAVISACEDGSATMLELSVGAAEFAIMRRACLLYLADHGDVDAIRHDVVSIVVTGERQAKLRHLIGAWQWAESKE
jgi:putative endonuclease